MGYLLLYINRLRFLWSAVNVVSFGNVSLYLITKLALQVEQRPTLLQGGCSWDTDGY